MNRNEPGRRDFFRRACWCTLGLAGSTGVLPAFAADGKKSALTPDEALARLQKGNAGYLDKPVVSMQDRARRLEIARGQAPFAVVVGCSDSRVPPEVLFGTGLGELFTVRNAGNTVDTAALGTIQYGVAVLGAGVMVSSWLWSGLLQRARGGGALALLCALLALATLLPVAPGLAGSTVAVFASGALFGAVFLSVVASTTALVRHNLPAAAWPGGIAAFTGVFAAGQIAGPSLVGWVADRAGGLAGGFMFSAAVLAVGALLAWRQRPLGGTGPADAGRRSGVRS